MSDKNYKDDITLDDVKITPWLEQYKNFKEQYPEELLLFRMGDFYELFFDDAKTAAAVLDIALTARDKDKKIPMAGIPYHALNIYLGRLIKAGYRAAICEQMSDTPPKGAKVVDRKIIRVATPGTYIPEENDFNFKDDGARLAAVNMAKNKIALAFLNVETGRLEAGTLIKSEAAALISAFGPSEVIIPSNISEQKILETLPVLNNYALHKVKGELFKLESAVSRLESALKNKKLSSFGFDDKDACIGSAWAALDYLSATQFSSVKHVLTIKTLSIKDKMNLDEAAQVNLDLIDGSASLFSCLDRCRTPMGRRTLRDWLLRPLMDISAIKRRQDAIGELINAPENIALLADLLAGTRDIERALSRLALGSGNPRDLAAIRDTLKLLPEILNLKILSSVINAFPAQALQELLNYLDAALEEELPRNLNSKPVIKSSFNKELASWRDVKERGEGWLAEYVDRERANTQTPRLKAGYTQAFGYYLETGKAGLVKTPGYFERRQTLVNSQRYTTPELRDFQDKMLHSNDEIARIEALIYNHVINKVISFSADLQMAGRLLGLLDCVASSALIARERGYNKPEVDNSMGIYIKAARHPVLEAVMTDQAFIPNDIILGEDKPRIIILTGPNMAGKSTWLRTAALLAIMAQAGLYIPAESAKIGLVDRVFTRIGARDDLARGSSTFMVEMLETANILNNVTERSLVILDEVGRGTATWDGMSIAWAVLEFLLYERPSTRVLFATHYHELTCLEDNKNIKNYSMAVRESKNGIAFLHQVKEGAADRSYGIEVARLAGLPSSVLKRALELLKIFESSELENLNNLKNFKDDVPDYQALTGQINFLENSQAQADLILDELKTLDLDNITPMQALKILGKLKDESLKL
ncbi:MAG: DNA mismatch repair protein MutS [Synergistaceae bacterium]|nr:DNA mismatch repair protein MutS [Synergistaceae bacterium]